MQTVAATITGYPNIGLREKTGTISDRKANAGIIRTHTRMPEDPEEVHPNHGRASSLRVKEVPAEITVTAPPELR